MSELMDAMIVQRAARARRKSVIRSHQTGRRSRSMRDVVSSIAEAIEEATREMPRAGKADDTLASSWCAV